MDPCPGSRLRLARAAEKRPKPAAEAQRGWPGPCRKYAPGEWCAVRREPCCALTESKGGRGLEMEVRRGWVHPGRALGFR